MFNRFIGVDVAKAKVDVFLSETGELLQIKNIETDLKRFVQSLERTEETLVIIDLTGGYETQCVKAFYQAGFTIHRAEGRKVKAFMRACGQLAKTDSIDARALADYGKRLQDKLTLFQPVDNEIKPYVMRLNELKQLLQMEKNRLQSPQTDNKIYEQVSRHIAFLKTEINFLAKELQQIIEKTPQLHQKQKVLTSQIGIGETTANLLLALLPELGYLPRRKIAALAGLAPYAKDSGTLNAARHVYGGRKEVKRALFICALTAIKRDKEMKCFYEKLIKNGKKKMVALVAVMRKLIIILNAKCKKLN